MLTDSQEIALVSTAQEPGLRDPRRNANGPQEILRDFFRDMNLKGHTALELGAGHYEFCELLRDRGVAMSAMELDPPIGELGRRRGFSIFMHDIRELPTFVPSSQFEGLICKGSNNPFWFYGDRAGLETFTDSLTKLVKPGGWSWVVSCPWTRESVPPREFQAWLDVEASLYAERGYRRWLVPHRFVGAHYGISVPCHGLAVYTLGLPPHRWSLPTLGTLGFRALRRGPARLVRAVIGRR